MRIKTVRKKGKRPPKEKGEPMPYKQLDKKGKGAKQIRGIYKAWLKAPKYALKLDAELEGERYYLGKKGESIFVTDRKKARLFAHGFDDPVVKTQYWSNKYKVKFKPENV